MKNKGRKHKALFPSSGGMNCKGWLTHITRSVEKMSKGNAGCFSSKSKGKKSAKFDKKKWSKRVRGYFKSQSKDILLSNQ
jgi:hypothetical protein